MSKSIVDDDGVPARWESERSPGKRVVARRHHEPPVGDGDASLAHVADDQLVPLLTLYGAGPSDGEGEKIPVWGTPLAVVEVETQRVEEVEVPGVRPHHRGVTDEEALSTKVDRLVNPCRVEARQRVRVGVLTPSHRR